MEINTYHRQDCSHAKGLCVVIDVLRAFTTAAFTFAGGAKEIILVSSIEEAFQKASSGFFSPFNGEEEGFFIEGFHYGNSPTEIKKANISDRRLVQRTSSGTQGVHACAHASHMLVASFVVAEATLKRILQLDPTHVSFIVTGRTNGDEDLAFAEYLQARLLNQQAAPDAYLQRVRSSPAAQRMLSANKVDYPYGKEDLDLAVQLDRFPFAMEVTQCKGEFVAKLCYPIP